MASKQAAAKEAQGFRKESPRCGNCAHFRLEKYREVTRYGSFNRERNLRCSLGGFKVGKSNYCHLWMSQEEAAHEDARAEAAQYQIPT